MCGDSFAELAGEDESGADFCGALSVRSARWVRLGLYDIARPQSGRQRAGIAIAGERAGCASPSGVQQEIQDYAFGVRAAFACGSGDYRIDGSGAWAVCASIVVLAEQTQHSRETETV